MKRTSWRCAIGAALLVTGCSSSSKTYVDGGPGQPHLTLRASPTSVTVDGSTIAVQVVASDANDNVGTGTVALTTDKGDFGTGGKSASVTLDASGKGTTTFSCNARTDSTCTLGTAALSASWLGATAQASVTLTAPSTYVDAGPSNDGGCGDLTGATLQVFTLNPATIGVQGNTSSQPTEASLVMLAKYADNTPAKNCTVVFTEQSGETLVVLNPASVTVDPATGQASTKVTSGTRTGQAHIIATLGSAVTQQVTLTIGSGGGTDAGPATPNSISWISTSPSNDLLGIAGSGRNEQGSMKFQVKDQFDNPLAGASVDFSQSGTDLVTLTPTTGTTDANGYVTANISAGPTVGVTSIVATVTGTTGNPIATSHSLAVRGARPSARNFYFRCEKLNLPVYTTTQQLESMNCTVRLADRFGNPIGIPTTVVFYTEAGTINANATTTAYDPSKSPTDNANEGSATVTFTSSLASGFGVPDVDPMPGEPVVQGRNPRDQLVTIIAVTQGEEAFYESVPNGIFEPDKGDTFVDLGDPFIDANDDNLYDQVTPGGNYEQRFCSSQNHVSCTNNDYSYGNGTWDVNGTIWTSTHVVFSGIPALSWIPPAGIGPGGFTPSPLNYGANSDPVPLYAYDRWLNLPSAGTVYATAVQQGPTGLGLNANIASPQFDNLGALDLQTITVAESDGGACLSANGPGCVLQTVFNAFDGVGVGSVMVSNTNSHTSTATPGVSGFAVDFTSTTTKSQKVTNTLSGSYAHDLQ